LSALNIGTCALLENTTVQFQEKFWDEFLCGLFRVRAHRDPWSDDVSLFVIDNINIREKQQLFFLKNICRSTYNAAHKLSLPTSTLKGSVYQEWWALI